MSKENSKVGEPIGFAGIAQLVSLVHLTHVSSTRLPPPQVKDAVEKPVPAASPIFEGSTVEPQKTASFLKWIVGAVAVFVVIGLIARGLDEESGGSAQSAPYSSPPPSSYTPSSAAEPPAPVEQRETKPPVGQGQGHVLGVPQIRYCVAEDIRMGGAEAALDLSDESQVNTFNTMVEDYNSRCSNYQYRVGNLERVQREVEARRESLRAEGALRLQSGSPGP